jgi:hypothetical protein
VVCTFALRTQSSVVPAITAIRGAVCRGRGVVPFASVSGMRTVACAANAWGCHLTGHIFNLLEQTSGAGSLVDGCCDGKWSENHDPVCQL